MKSLNNKQLQQACGAGGEKLTPEQVKKHWQPVIDKIWANTPRGPKPVPTFSQLISTQAPITTKASLFRLAKFNISINKKFYA